MFFCDGVMCRALHSENELGNAAVTVPVLLGMHVRATIPEVCSVLQAGEG